MWEIRSVADCFTDYTKKKYLVKCKTCGYNDEYIASSEAEVQQQVCPKCKEGLDGLEFKGKAVKKSKRDQIVNQKDLSVEVRWDESAANQQAYLTSIDNVKPKKILKRSNNTQQRLKKIWKDMIRRNPDDICEEWLSSYEIFEQWAYNNGYEHWKILHRKNDKVKYRPSNCEWILDIDKIYDTTNIQNTEIFTFRVYSNILVRIVRILIEIKEIKRELTLLNKSNYVANPKLMETMRKNLAAAELHLEKFRDTASKLQIGYDKVTDKLKEALKDGK